MNGFTKEELNLIHFLSTDRIEAIGYEEAEKEGTAKISFLIERMIDSFCEHKEKHKEWLAYQCDKCGMMFNCNNQ
jgi:hypothetical protein